LRGLASRSGTHRMELVVVVVVVAVVLLVLVSVLTK
jgi:hypothetical protein